MRKSYLVHVGLNGVYNGDSEFMAGESIMFSGPADKIPAGYLIEDGSEVGRVAYATLFAAIGTTYGAGDGATTFNLPDSRAEGWRGLDLGRGVDVGRIIGSSQGDAGRNLTGHFAGGANNPLNWSASHPLGVFSVKVADFSATTGSGNGEDLYSFDASRQWPVANEFRMRNIAKIPLIKY